MAKTTSWLFLTVLFTMVESCSTSKNADKNLLPDKDHYEISPDMNDVSDYSISDFFNLDSLVFLETKPGYLIAKLSGLILKNNKIYILDDEQEQIIAYSIKGEAIGKINNIGKGPMEYARLSDFDVFNEKLYLCDPDYNTFHQYDANSLAPIKPIEGLGAIASFVMLDENRLFGYSGNLFNSFTKVGDDKYNNVFFRSFSSVEASFLPFLSSHRGRIYKCGSAQSSIVQYEDKYFYYDQPRLTAYKIHTNGNLSEYFKVLGRSSGFSEATMDVEEFASNITQKDSPSLLNNLNIQEKFIYYQFLYNQSGYRGLFLKKTGRNILFKIGSKDDYFGVNVYMVPYKGEGHGLVGYLDPSDFFSLESSNPIEESGIQSSLSDIKPNDNPILVFMSLKRTFDTY